MSIFTGIENFVKKSIAIFHKDAPAAVTALNEVAVGAHDFAAVAAAAGESNSVIAAAGKVAGVASLGATALSAEVSAHTAAAVSAGITDALGDLKSIGVVGSNAQANLDSLDGKVTAAAKVVDGIVSDIQAAPAGA